jgi:hypothetical protein
MGIRSMTMKMEFDSGLFRREVLRVGNQKSADYERECDNYGVCIRVYLDG